jgi:hypothetical protein
LGRHLAPIAIGLLFAGCTTPTLPGAELADAAHVRITNDRELARDCAFLGTASDRNDRTLQQKAAWLGGDVAVVTPASQEARAANPPEHPVWTTAEVFRCEPVPPQTH